MLCAGTILYCPGKRSLETLIIMTLYRLHAIAKLFVKGLAHKGKLKGVYTYSFSWETVSELRSLDCHYGIIGPQPNFSKRVFDYRLYFRSRSGPPLIQLWGLGSAVRSSSEVRGKPPAANAFLCILRLKMAFSDVSGCFHATFPGPSRPKVWSNPSNSSNHPPPWTRACTGLYRLLQ